MHDTVACLQASCLMTMQSGSDGIADVQWSPDNGTVFAAATAGGQLQLWDLESSILSPTATFAFPGECSPSNTPNLGPVSRCSSKHSDLPLPVRTADSPCRHSQLLLAKP